MHLLRIGLVAFAGLFAAACSAGSAPPAPYELGKQYTKVHAPQKPADPKRVTVEEFFWYGCPHCFHLDPEVTAWVAKKPADVDFSRVPDTLGRPEGEVHARAFYIAKFLGVSDRIHKALFAAIHEQHMSLNTLESVREFFAQAAGTKPAEFDAASSNFVVAGDEQRAEALARDYGITSVPAFVVGGEYLVINQTDTLKVVDFVVDQVRKERKR